MGDELLRARCWGFVEQQAEGEWGDDLIARDTDKLMAFVQAEVSAREAAMRAALEAENARLRDQLRAAREALVPDWCWCADDPERPFDDPLEWFEDVWPSGSDPIVERFQWAMRAPDSWELFIPPADEDGDWTVQSFTSAADAEAARAALAGPARDGGGA